MKLSTFLKPGLPRIGFLAIVSLFLIIAISATVSIASSSVYVSGIVKYNGDPVSGATVTATHGSSAPVSTTTGSSGSYSLTVTYEGAFEDTTIMAEYNGVSLSPVIGADELKMSSKITRDFNLVSKATPTPTPELKPTPTPVPKPAENRFYIFTLVDGKATNGIPVTCTYKGLTFTGTSGNVDIEDADIPYSYHGPGVVAFYLPTGGEGTVKFRVDTVDYSGEKAFGSFPEPFYKYGEMTVTRRTTATPIPDLRVSPTPTPRAQWTVEGLVYYNGERLEGVNLSLDYDGVTENFTSRPDGAYYFIRTYADGQASLRAYCNDSFTEYRFTPTSDLIFHDFRITGPAGKWDPTAYPTAGSSARSPVRSFWTPTPTYYITGVNNSNSTSGQYDMIPVNASPGSSDAANNSSGYMVSINASPGTGASPEKSGSASTIPFPGVWLTVLAVLAAVLVYYRRK